MKIALWVVQSLLALAFVGAGLMKLTTPMPELAANIPILGTLPEALVRFIGAAELTGALGLVLPGLTRIRPRLTVWAAYGLLTIMVLAAIVHVAGGEPGAIAPNLVLGGLAYFVAWGRTHKAPLVSGAARTN